ncbi:hypothetical protein RRF57_011313 [Xylaria bambusicola]|uniref:Uncharacterized protein n=1 Tax=Xylaria bambusicola TaxID=326684 RepID=A0AAN7ZD38_9PEZI
MAGRQILLLAIHVDGVDGFIRESGIRALDIALERERLNSNLIQIPHRLVQKRLPGREEIAQSTIQHNRHHEAEHPIETIQML